MAGNFLKLMTESNHRSRKNQRTPHKKIPKILYLGISYSKHRKTKTKKKILERSRRVKITHLTFRRIKIKITLNFSLETM